MCSRLFRVVVECEASGASRMQVDAYAAGAPGGGPVLQAATPSVRVGCSRCGAAGLPSMVHKRMGMEWPAAAGVVDDRGYCGRGPAQVSASGVDTVAFRSFGEVVVL